MKGIICHILHLSPLSLEFLMICRPLLTVYNILLLRSHCMNIHLTLQRFSVAVTFLHTLFKPEKCLHQINRCMHYLNTENAHKRSIIAQNLRRGKEYYTTVEPLLCAINCTEIKVFFVWPELASAKRREALLVLKTTPRRQQTSDYCSIWHTENVVGRVLPTIPCEMQIATNGMFSLEQVKCILRWSCI